ncbi:MAG TPA: SusC/RagA family TonB-linked outer membrane protein, partial [Arachidicoccus sp.]
MNLLIRIHSFFTNEIDRRYTKSALIVKAGRPFFPRANRISKMFLATLFLSISILSKANDSTISIHEKQKPLALILNDISLQTKIHFFYKDEDIAPFNSESLDVKNANIKDALKVLLKDKKLYFIEENGVFLIKKNQETSLFINTSYIENAQATNTTNPKSVRAFELKGMVTDSAGKGLEGASVVLLNKSKGVKTDSYGKFSIAVEQGDKLSVGMIGFITREVTVASQGFLIIALKQESKSLDEVVVTALGISRKKSAVVYDVAEVKGNELTQARENNIANALTGKVAGVNATGISTGPGGSSRVIIRGNGSLSGANQPLYVVNGMPIDNSVPGGSATSNGVIGNVDRGDGIGDINPDDIESISVLKGGAAAALYGARAANGVILITTKKGVMQKGIGVTYSTDFTMENISSYPDWQYEYGQGDNGTKPTTQAEAIAQGRHSFGAKIDGSTFVAADGKEHPYVAQKDNLKHFYQTGNTFTNTLALTGGSKEINYRFSMSSLNSNSILPNSKFDRKTFNLNVSGELSNKLSYTAMAQYNYEVGKNRPDAGDALGNPNWTPYMIGNTSDIRWLAPGYDSVGNEIPWNDANIASNSYFVVNKIQELDDKNRFIGQFSLNYNILDNLSIKGTISKDFYNYNYKYILPYGTLYIPFGQLNEIKSDLSEMNYMVTANYNTNIGSDFSLNAMAGVNQRKFTNNELDFTGTHFIIPYFYSLTNLQSYTTTPVTQRTETNSSFGSLDFSYKNLAFITLTGRNDWFSTLSPSHNSIFYPSVGGSLLLNKMVSLPSFINYFKLRGSWAQVGGATPDPYAINIAYKMIPSS